MTGTTYPPSYPNGPPIPPRDDDDVAASGGPSMDSLMANLRHANGTINPETVSDITAVLGTLAGINVTGADFDNALALAVAAGLTGIHKDGDHDNNHDHAHSEGHFNLADTQQATQYREMFGAALRSAGDFIEGQFAASADADGSVGDGDSDGVESLVAAAIKVAEDNADHFIDIGHGQGAEGADHVDADTAVELLDRVCWTESKACWPPLAAISTRCSSNRSRRRVTRHPAPPTGTSPPRSCSRSWAA